MRKEIILTDFLGNRTNIYINNFEKVRSIDIEVISGDEVAYIYYDDTLTRFDSSKERIVDYLDGYYSLRPDQLDKFNAFEGSSYDRLEYFKNLEEMKEL